jgi:hypothetical protein
VPCACVTTTQTSLHPENETRLFSLGVTDTQEQTEQILMALADDDAEAESLESWKALQTWLEAQTHDVHIHYAKLLASMIPPVAVRLRRDFAAVLRLIKSHAILHQAQREKDAEGRILATHKDYAVVYDLVHKLIAEGVEASVKEEVRETVKAVEGLIDDEEAHLDDEDREYVSGKQVAKALNLDKSSASRRVRQALQSGYIKNLETRKYQPQKLAIGEPLPEDRELLPHPKELEELCCPESGCTVARQNEGGRGCTTPSTPLH